MRLCPCAKKACLYAMGDCLHIANRGTNDSEDKAGITSAHRRQYLFESREANFENLVTKEEKKGLTSRCRINHSADSRCRSPINVPEIDITLTFKYVSLPSVCQFTNKTLFLNPIFCNMK